MIKKRLPSTVYLFLVAVGLFLSLAALPVKAASPVLITYTYEHELLPKQESEPLLTIYLNGSIRAVFPPYMKNAGVRNAQLSPSALQTLIAFISTDSMQHLNTQSIAEEITLHQAQQEQSGNTGETVYAVMDSTTTIIEYQPLLSGSTQKITLKDVSSMARQYPGIANLQTVKQLMTVLQSILDTSAWVSTGDKL